MQPDGIALDLHRARRSFKRVAGVSAVIPLLASSARAGTSSVALDGSRNGQRGGAEHRVCAGLGNKSHHTGGRCGTVPCTVAVSLTVLPRRRATDRRNGGEGEAPRLHSVINRAMSIEPSPVARS